MKIDVYVRIVLSLIAIGIFIPMLVNPPVTNKANAFVGNKIKYQIVNSTKENWVWILNTETGNVKVCYEWLQIRSKRSEVNSKSPLCSEYSN